MSEDDSLKDIQSTVASIHRHIIAPEIELIGNSDEVPHKCASPLQRTLVRVHGDRVSKGTLLFGKMV